MKKETKEERSSLPELKDVAYAMYTDPETGNHSMIRIKFDAKSGTVGGISYESLGTSKEIAVQHFKIVIARDTNFLG